MVPVLPIAVVYEPPQFDKNNQNRASYSATTSIGTTIGTSFGQSESTTQPTSPSKFQSVQGFKNVLEVYALAHDGFGKNAPDPKAKAAAALASDALKAIAKGLGTAEAHLQVGKETGHESRFLYEQFESDTIITNARQGPGKGDLIYFLKNARVVWVANDGEAKLTLLGWDERWSRPVGALKDQTDNEPSGLRREDIIALFSLDPFVAGGPNMKLPYPRFRCIDVIGVEATKLGKRFGIAAEKVNRDVTTSFRTTTEDYRKRWLSFLGIGVTETSSNTITLTQSSSIETKAKQEIVVSTDLYAEPGEVYAVEVY
jgi:hypothetical protein